MDSMYHDELTNPFFANSDFIYLTRLILVNLSVYKVGPHQL